MTDRERWTVYPLLFFAIMMGVVDLAQRGGLLNPWTGPPRFQEVRCRKLVIEDFDERPIAVMNQNEFGEMQLSMLHDEGAAVILTTGTGGGNLLLIRASDQKAIYAGHDAERTFSGIEGVELRHGTVVPLPERGESLELLRWSKEEKVAEKPVEKDVADE